MKLPFELSDPRGLWLLSALVPLVVLYVLKIRRTRVPVSSTWLWAAARRDVLARSPLKRFVAQVPLLLQAIALILLALALAKPATRHRGIAGDHVAIVVDTSASMQTIDSDGKRRIDLAKAAAVSAVSALAPGADAIVIEAAREPRIVTPSDRDVRRIEEAIASIDARDVEGDLGAAVALAVEKLSRQSGSKRLLVFTDGDLAVAGGLRNVSVPMDVVKVGDEADNVAIVRVDVRAGIDPSRDREEVQGFVLVQNFAKKAREVFVTMRLANVETPLASRKLLVQPAERAPVVLTFEPAPGDRGKGLVFEISPHDALAVDDVAYGRVPFGRDIDAVLAGPKPSPWLARALSADPHVVLWRGTTEELAKATIPDGALAVFDGVCPAAPPPGDVLIVNPPKGRCLGVGVGDSIDKPSITSWAHGDPRLRFLTLDGVHIAKASSLETDGESQDLVRSQHDVLVADASIPGRTATIVGFDVGESDWPLKASFVLFVRNVVELARLHRAHAEAETVPPGEPLRVAVDPAVTTAMVAAPGAKEEREIPARAGLAVVSDTTKAGFYVVSWKGTRPASALVPVSLVSEKESDLGTHRALDASQTSVVAAAEVTDTHADLGWIVALVALVFIVLDAWWLTRKPSPRVLPTGAPPRPVRERSVREA